LTAVIWTIFAALAIAVFFWATKASVQASEQDLTGTPWSADAPNCK